MVKESPRNNTRNYANKIIAGIALTASLSGCTSLQRSGYGVVKTVDGVARFGTGASVAEKMGVYSTNPQDPNYKAPENYTGNGIGDRVTYTLMTPVKAVRQTGEGIGQIVGGIYGATIGQFIPNNTTGQVIDEVINPDKREGLPILVGGLDYAEENFGHVETDSPKRRQLEERLDTTGEKITGSIPVAHPLGDESLPWHLRVARSIGNGFYYALSFLGGGSGSGSNGGVGGTSSGGGWGVGGPGAK